MLIEWTIVGVMAKDNINEVAYNTKTAEAIARNGSGREIMHSDERWFNETLYRKKSGEFFLYGSGGIFTKYARQTGPNSWERSEAILPLFFGFYFNTAFISMIDVEKISSVTSTE